VGPDLLEGLDWAEALGRPIVVASLPRLATPL